MLSLGHARQARITVETINGITEEDTTAVDGLVIRCSDNHAKLYSSSNVFLPTTYGVESLPFSKKEMSTPNKLKQWDYLSEVAKSIPVLNENTPFSLLIGANCAKALEP